MKPSLTTTIKSLAVLVMFALIITVANAFTAPTTAAPGGNVFAPVNTGATAQTKPGTLGVLGLVSMYGVSAGDGFTVDRSQTYLSTKPMLDLKNPNTGKSISVDTNGVLTYKDGKQGAGKVLVSDANGAASWANTSTESPIMSTSFGKYEAYSTTGNVEVRCPTGSFATGGGAICLNDDMTNFYTATGYAYLSYSMPSSDGLGWAARCNDLSTRYGKGNIRAYVFCAAPKTVKVIQ